MQTPGRGCFTYTPRRKPVTSTFPSVVSCWSGLSQCHGRLPACGWKHSTYQKNGRKLVGPFRIQWTCLHSQLTAGKAQLHKQRGFYRKGLNRHLPRQTKPAPGLALEMEAKAGMGRGTVSLKSSLQLMPPWLHMALRLCHVEPPRLHVKASSGWSHLPRGDKADYFKCNHRPDSRHLKMWRGEPDSRHLKMWRGEFCTTEPPGKPNVNTNE